MPTRWLVQDLWSCLETELLVSEMQGGRWSLPLKDSRRSNAMKTSCVLFTPAWSRDLPAIKAVFQLYFFPPTSLCWLSAISLFPCLCQSFCRCLPFRMLAPFLQIGLHTGATENMLRIDQCREQKRTSKPLCISKVLGNQEIPKQPRPTQACTPQSLFMFCP